MVTIEITDQKLINAFTKEEMQQKTVKYLNSILKSRKRKKIEKSKITDFEIIPFSDEEGKELLSNKKIVDGLKRMEEILSKRRLGKYKIFYYLTPNPSPLEERGKNKIFLINFIILKKS